MDGGGSVGYGSGSVVGRLKKHGVESRGSLGLEAAAAAGDVRPAFVASENAWLGVG